MKNQSTPQLLLNEQLCFPIYAASRLITRAYQPWLEKVGLTYPQYLVMMVLWESQPITVSAIGAKLLLNSNTLTPLLKKLQQKELIIKERSATDEREVKISLTEKGESLRKQAACIPLELVNSIEMEPEELMQMRALMWKLVDVLSTENQQA